MVTLANRVSTLTSSSSAVKREGIAGGGRPVGVTFEAISSLFIATGSGEGADEAAVSLIEPTDE